MKIRSGYNSKELSIKIEGTDNRTANMWIEFGTEPKKETLSYLTLDELLDLKAELQRAINKITGD